MLGKMEVRTPPGGRPRDGRHCDLCGCSQPAVRCDKCGCQIFCLSCDDMYHRHPKRRFHLRKAVDSTPPVPQARPVLPVKVAHLNATNPGDPSKMPLPPPRKKKSSLFGSFRRPSPSSDNSPPLPKKEYSWTDRLGSIKKFMSNRPLPPLPTADDHDGDTQPTTNGQTTPPRGDLSFIHKRNEERPPQLPSRSPRPQDFPGFNQERDSRTLNAQGHMPGPIRNGSFEPNMNHMNQNRDFSGDESQWNNQMPNHNGPQAFGTLNRQNNRGFMPPGGPGFPGGMHQSSSATDLHSLHNMEAMPGAGPLPAHYPHYPMNPQMPPHYPYPMYPQYPNYPQYFGNSFASVSNPPTTDGDVSDSETSTRHSSKKYPFRKKAKRSQSVMVDRMGYPGQFYPFGPYPGYGPWGAPMPMDAPPSPATSLRSLNRTGRSRRRKKTTSEEDEEEFSVSSSPMSRPKSSSSERHPKGSPQRAPLATQTTSSEDESEYDGDRRRNKVNTIQRRTSEPMKTASSPAMERKRPPKLKKKSTSKQSDSEPQEEREVEMQNERRTSRDSNAADQPAVEPSPPSASASSSTWECKHCTFINPITNKICVVCCKTASPRTETPVTANSRPPSATENARKPSVGSEQGCSSPEKAPEIEDEGSKKDKQDMAILNSALDEAEKEISRGLEELMKLKDDMGSNVPKERNATSSKETETEVAGGSKPTYKSSGRMRTSILDKLNINKPQTSKSSASTSTEVQTEQGGRTTDKIIEARRYSNSSTTSETYNSPLAQSPELGNDFNKQKRDSSCQTQQDNLAEYLERKRTAEEAFLGRPVNNFGFGYADRMDMMTSPVPTMYDRFIDRGFGMMQRSHSRASLFTGRLNDLGPMEYGGPAFGYGGTPMYRSVSRGSLTGDYPDSRMSEFQNLRRPDYYLSMEELVERRRQEDMRAQGLELVRMIREAEQQGFTADDIQVALTHCGKQSPMEWLQNNWRNMVDSVITLSTNYGNDKKENDIGLLSENEARDALRLHKGNIWAAVTECVEGRQRKYLELSARGKFTRQDIIDALTASDGDVEMAYANLSKNAGKPFLMRIWGAGEGAQNQDGAQPIPEDLKNDRHLYQKDDIANCDDLSDDLWSEDGAVNWEEDEEDFEEERADLEDLQTCREDLYSGSHELRTPESDKSDYCDAFALEDKNMSPSSDDIFFVIPDTKPEKKKGFLSKLAALRKNSKEQIETVSNKVEEELAPEQVSESKSDTVSQNSNSSSEQAKGNGALSALKSTFAAIKDTVTGAAKSDRKIPCTQPEKRTIIVTGHLDHESLSESSNDNVKLASVNKDVNLGKQRNDIECRENTAENSDLKNKEKQGAKLSAEDRIVPEIPVTENNRMQSNQQIPENSSKQSDFKSNLESKKSQSLAERLKLAKQSYTSKEVSNSKEIRNDSGEKNASNIITTKELEKFPNQGTSSKFAEEKREDTLLSSQLTFDKRHVKERKDNERQEESFASNFVESKENHVQQESSDITHINTNNSNSSPQTELKAATENILPKIVDMSSAKINEIHKAKSKSQETRLEDSPQNKTEETFINKTKVIDKAENSVEQQNALKQNIMSQDNSNFRKIKETNNTANIADVPAAKSDEIDKVKSKNQENRLESSSQNKTGETSADKKEVINKLENAAEQQYVLKQKLLSQDNSNFRETKEINNTKDTYSSEISDSLKSNVNAKIETAIKDISSDSEINSNNINPDNFSGKSKMPEKENELYTIVELKELETGDKEILSSASSNSNIENSSTVESEKLISFHKEVKSKIFRSPTGVKNSSNDSSTTGIYDKIPNHTSKSESDISSSTDKFSPPLELKLNTFTDSKEKASSTQDPKQDMATSSTERVISILDSKLNAVASSVDTVENTPGQKQDVTLNVAYEITAKQQATETKTENLIVVDTLASASERTVTNIDTDKKISGESDVLEEFKNTIQESSISEKFDNKQISEIHNEDMHDKVKSKSASESSKFSPETLQGTSENATESVEKESVKLGAKNEIIEVLESKSNLPTDIKNVEHSNVTQITESSVKENTTEIDKQLGASLQTTNLEKSAEEKIEPSVSVLNQEIRSESSGVVINSADKSLDKSNAVIPEKHVNDSSVSLKNDDIKPGKIKSSKTGKAKKYFKDNKNVQNDNAIKSEETPTALAESVSNSVNENEMGSSNNVNIVNFKNETLPIASTSNESSSKKKSENEFSSESNTDNLKSQSLPTASTSSASNLEKEKGHEFSGTSNMVIKSSGDSNSSSLKTELPKSNIEAPKTINHSLDKTSNEQSVNQTVLENTPVTSEVDPTIQANKVETLKSEEVLPTLKDETQLQSTANNLLGSKQSAVSSSESNTSVAVGNFISENSSGVKVMKTSEDSTESNKEQSIKSSSEATANSPSDAENNILLESNTTQKINVNQVIETNHKITNQVETSTSVPESSFNVRGQTNFASSSGLPGPVTGSKTLESRESAESAASSLAPEYSDQHSMIQNAASDTSSTDKEETATVSGQQASTSEELTENYDNTSQAVDSDDTDIEYSDESRPSSVTPPNPVDTLRNRFEILSGGTSLRGPVRPQSPFRRMSFNSRKQVIALERIRDTTMDKPWVYQKKVEPAKVVIPKRTIKQQLEMERRVRKMVSDRKVRTYRKAEIVVQLMDMHFEEEEAIQAANECSTLEQAISYLQQECLLCAGHFPVSQIVSMTHCQHRACRECIRAYFTVQIRDRTILDLLCPFCNEPDIGDEDIAQDYFNHLDIMLKKLVDFEIHELFQRKLRDRVLMKDPNFRWCSQCSSGFIAMPNLKRLVCPDCNAVTCASCRRLWEREHQGISCEAFAALKDASDPETQAAGLAKMLTEDGISCPSCHFRYALAKGGCMHFRCIQCQHDFCSGCSRPFKMGQKCGVSEFCAKLGLHAHHPRNCLFYLRDKEPEDLQKLLDMNDVKYNKEVPESMELKSTCQVMEQKETSDGMVDDFCGKEVQDGYAGLCRIHYVEYLGQLVNKNKVDPIQIFDTDDLELVLRRASIRLPAKKFREADEQYKERLINLIEEELPLDKMDGS